MYKIPSEISHMIQLDSEFLWMAADSWNRHENIHLTKFRVFGTCVKIFSQNSMGDIENNSSLSPSSDQNLGCLGSFWLKNRQYLNQHSLMVATLQNSLRHLKSAKHSLWIDTDGYGRHERMKLISDHAHASCFNTLYSFISSWDYNKKIFVDFFSLWFKFG